MLRQIVFLSVVVGALGGFNNRAPGFGNQGFSNPGFGNTFGGNTASFDNSRFQATNQAEGSAAGAGNAGVGGEGEAQSINTADHAAGDGKTQSKGQSLNTARGTGGVTAGGAAQAGGKTASQKQGERLTGFQNENANFGNSGFGSGGNFRGNGGIGGGRPIGNIGGGGFNQRPGFTGGGMGGGNFGGSNSGTQGTKFNKQSESGGTAAGAGTATVIDGQATSDNQAEHFADDQGTRSSGSSLNAAGGFSPNTQGAAQAGGTIAQLKEGQKVQQNNNRRWN